MKQRVARVRDAAWAARKRISQLARDVLPRWATYTDQVALHMVKDAWPALAAPAPAPLTYWPTEEQRPWFDQAARFRGQPVILPPILVHELRGGIIFPDSGTIATHDGKLIAESCKDSALEAYTSTFGTWRLQRPRDLGPGPISTVMIGKLQFSYGHWILDCLPRLWALSKVPDRVKLLVPSTVAGVKRTLLELACPDNVELVDVEPEVPVRGERVLLTPFTTYGGCGLLRPEIVEYLSGRLVAAAKQKLGSGFVPKAQIYVSRERAGWSRISNEDQLKASLAKLGIANVIAEELSIHEQILTFHHARLVVGALGSGLVNCLFQDSGALIELFAGGQTPESLGPSLNNAGVAIAKGLAYAPVYHSHLDSEPSFEVDVARASAAVAAMQARLKLS